MLPWLMTLGLGILAAIAVFQWRRSRGEAAAMKARATSAEAAAAALQRKVNELARYQGVADADARAREIVAEAETLASSLRHAAESQQADAARAADGLLTQARAEADAILSRAKASARDAGQQGESILAAARARADALIREAENSAAEIAGEALEAMRNAERWQETVTALKNTVEGYGSQYIVPRQTLLDELAEAYGHTEPGAQLKLLRTRMRQMVKEGRAAECDYVEANRKETAVRFVTDAFDGKADSILARIRQDNAGTLQQELRDARTLVNRNGVAFRNARISEEYFQLRLEELRWAAAIEELRVQEREEQRRIKEQLREEEKARREIEKAIREAAKEEDMLRRAMEKAREQLAKSSEAQKAQFEQRLAELQQKLQDAEARNQRAISMAQQTRRGHVYIISNVGSLGEDVYKIGLTRRLEPLDRIRELGDSSVPFEFDVHALIFSEDAPGLEAQLHKHFVLAQVNKVNHRKEFFRAPIAHIRSEVEALGLTAQWTMTAAAREYRETLAIEEMIRDNPDARDAWTRRQLLLEDVEVPFADEADDAPVSEDRTPMTVEA